MNQKSLEILATVLIATGIIFLIGSSIYFGLRTDLAEIGKIDGELTGAIGSFISGIVGVLFSLASVILFFIALSSQKEELRAQGLQLELQREELALQRNELVETRATFRLQQFEAAFFNLLSSQQQIRSFVQNHNDNFRVLEVELGNRLDRYQISWLQMRYMEHKMGVLFENIKADTFEQFVNIAYHIDVDELKKNSQKYIYQQFLEDYSSILINYVNNLFIIVKYLFDSESDQNSAVGINYQKYFDYVIAPMSRPELYLIGQHVEAFPGLADLLNHFNWLKRFDNDNGLMV